MDGLDNCPTRKDAVVFALREPCRPVVASQIGEKGATRYLCRVKRLWMTYAGMFGATRDHKSRTCMSNRLRRSAPSAPRLDLRLRLVRRGASAAPCRARHARRPRTPPPRRTKRHEIHWAVVAGILRERDFSVHTRRRLSNSGPTDAFAFRAFSCAAEAAFVPCD